MRLICPSCAAQYEVDDSVIPEAGRDVQCSNCGHSWFQPGKFHVEAETEASPEPVVSDEAELADDGQSDDLIRALSEDPDIPGKDGPTPEPEPSALPLAERRQPDPSVLSVLREEAEREARARRAEGVAAPLEQQTDFGLSGTAEGMGVLAGAGSAARPAADEDPPMPVRVAHSRDDDEPDEAAHRGQRKGLLPDIEEINSTLSRATGRSGRAQGFDELAAAEVTRRQRGGFRMGFSVAFLIAILLLVAYAFAPAIAARAPALAGPLTAYVTQVDTMRLWIDDKMKSSTEALRGTEAGAGG